MNKNSWFEHSILRRALALLSVLVLTVGILPAAALAETKYGFINDDDVRFRKQASSTEVWTMLDTGWVVEIRSEKRSGGEDYYYVVSNIPKHLDRTYYGYINQDYVTLMTAEEVTAWKNKGGNGGEISTGSSEPAVMTDYARPNNASTNYYSFDGSSLTSLGLLSASEAYYVSGSSTINDEAYYIISVNNVNCYVRADAMTMITTGDSAATPGKAPEGHIGIIRLVADGTVNLRSSATMRSDNVVHKVKQGTELPYYKTVQSGNHTWYYCYNAGSEEYGYIIDNFAKVISTVATQPPASTATATPKPGASGTAIGQVKITPEGSTHIRKTTKINSNNVAAKAEQGDILPYYAVSVVNGSRWYYVYHAGKDVFGYVLGSCVDVVGGEANAPTVKPSATPKPNDSTVKGYIVLTAGGVNLRKTASTGAATLGQFDKGDIFPYYSTTVKGSVTWYKAATEEGVGYFHGDFCSPSDASGDPIAPNPGSPAETESFVVTTKDKVYLRKSASTKAGTYGQIKDKGTLIPIVGAKARNNGYDWYRVEYNGNTGYIRSDCVKVLTKEEAEHYQSTGALPTPKPTPTPAPKPTEYIITTVDKVWVRKSPSTKAGTAGQLKEGAVFKFTGTTKVSGVTWYEVPFDGATRYIKGNCVKVMTNNEYNQYLAGLPTPTPAPTPTPEPDPSTLSDLALTRIEKVIVRGSGKASGKQLALVYRAETECKLLGQTNKSDGYTWYYLKVQGTTGWIRGDLIRVLTKTEAAMYEKVGDPDAKPEASYTTLQFGATGEAVTNLQKRLKQLGYLTDAQVTGTYDEATKSAIKKYQGDHEITVDGIAGSITQHSLFGTVETGYYNQNNGSSTTVVLHKPELIDWYKGGIQQIFPRRGIAVLTDVRTGISFKIKRWSGGDHADVEPLTAADTAAMCRIYKVKDAQEINDKNLYQRRPVLITIGSHSYAASMFGMPHNYPAGDTISGNDFYGQFCIHFTNSQLHDGKGVDKPSAKNGYFSHTMAIKEAYETAVEKLNIK
ncbi:MAG: peptidoglycan-binding protein [Clostridia bacterium]|nr:peptidoglycan-binding protein [Clostridia bacterium]